MKIHFGPKGVLMIDEAKLVYRNFEGRASKFNREGDRNFAVIIPTQELAEELMDAGWNVKIKPPRDEDDSPFRYLTVKVKFNARGPAAYLKSGSAPQVELDEESIKCLDEIEILSADMDIRPYDWEVNGKLGRTAYLQAIHVTQKVDRFAERYECDE